MKSLLALIILDGWGVRKQREGNAISLADTKNFDRFKKEYSYTTLKASGMDVGLMKGMMGNSETGHQNIGAGRVVKQEILKINNLIQDKSFFKNPALLKAVKNVKKQNSVLHLMGLLSDAGVHSYGKHLFALLKLASQYKVKKVMIHVFTDGRDTGIQSAKKYIRRLNKEMKKYRVGKIATIVGRYYAMDRDNRWDRTKKAYDLLVKAKGRVIRDAISGIDSAYDMGETDEFFSPMIINEFKGIKDNDSVVFFNFRSDRPRQLVKAFTQTKFINFKRRKKKLVFVCMNEYYRGARAEIVTREQKVKNVLGEILSRKGLHQLRISETEKCPHVTFFFNIKREIPFSKEDRICVPSPKVAAYDLSPEMSAIKIKDLVVKEIRKDKYQFIVLNFANADMVGHTGNLKAAICAVETVDKCLGKIVEEIRKKGGKVIIFSDHGNAEHMIDAKTKKNLSTHTTNLVPCIIIDDRKYKLKKGRLSDIAPTVLELMGFKKPKEMTGNSLI